ncbi:MAG: hypothetical protein ACKOQ4_08550 [Mycobacterium sp.]
MTTVRFALQRMAVCLQYWPQLAAIYLVGLLARDGAISLAAWAGHDNDVWASLVMPLAVLARLGSLVAMLLALRPAFPEFATDATEPRRPINVFASVVVPAFAIYLGWQMFKEDWLAFESRALTYRIGEAMSAATPADLHPEALPASHVTIAIILSALLMRFVLGRLDDRLPRWTVVLRVYIDALWVFLVLTLSASHGLKLLINPGGWVRERRVVVWLDSVVNSAVSQFHPLRIVWDGLCASVRAVFGGAAVPLIWLAVAGIVYGVSARASWLSIGRRVIGRRADDVLARANRPGRRLRRRWDAMPKKLRERSREDAAAKLGKYRPLAESARLIVHAGVLGLAAYVLAYLVLAWLDMSGSFYTGQPTPGYLFRGMAMFFGPRPSAFHHGFDPTLSLLSHLIVQPVRMCVIATAFAYCVHHARTAESGLQQQAKQDPAV